MAIKKAWWVRSESDDKWPVYTNQSISMSIIKGIILNRYYSYSYKEYKMSTFVIALILWATEAFWAVIGKLVTKAFLEGLITKLVVAGLDKLAASISNTLDYGLVKDVKSALNVDGK